MGDKRIIPERLVERITAAQLSYSRVARLLGVKQPTISRLAKGVQGSTARIDRLATILDTTPAYLTGETDDPVANATPKPPAQPYQAVTMQVLLPAEDALARMFVALLSMVNPAAPTEEQARLLARNLPIGLSQLRDLLPSPVSVVRANASSGLTKTLVEQQ